MNQDFRRILTAWLRTPLGFGGFLQNSCALAGRGLGRMEDAELAEAAEEYAASYESRHGKVKGAPDDSE